MKRFFCLVAMVLLMITPVRGEEVTVVTNPGATGEITTSTSFIQLEADMAAPAQVSLLISDAQGKAVHQQHYGLQDTFFQSDEIYLPAQGQSTDYTVRLTLGDDVRTLVVHRKMGRLLSNQACSVGYPLSAVTGRNTWQSVTMIDFSASSTVTVPLHASNAYQVGSAVFSLSGNQLSLSLSFLPGIQETLYDSRVQIAATALEATEFGSDLFQGLSGSISDTFTLGDVRLVAVYLDITMDYDPTGAAPAPEVTLPGQAGLWHQMERTTASDAVG